MGRKPHGSHTKSGQSSSKIRPKREGKRRKIFDPTDSGLKPSKRPRTSYNADDGQYSSSGENDFLDLSIDESRDMESEDNSRSAVGMDSSYLDVSSPVEPVVVKRRQGRPRKDSIVIPKGPGPGPQKFSPKKRRLPDVCDICKTGKTPSRLLVLKCSECSRKFHADCVNYSEQLCHNILMMRFWQCLNCKVCHRCNKGDGSDDSMLFCDSCDRAFHLVCHLPPLLESPEGRWECYKCQPKKKPEKPARKPRSDLSAAAREAHSKTASEKVGMDKDKDLISQFSSIIPQRDKFWTLINDMQQNIDTTNVPDILDWTPRQVANYFKSIGYSPNLCVAFLRQDIDGSALCNLTRDDVLTKLGLKIGPALKVYEETKRLQAKNSRYRSILNTLQ